MANHKDAAKRAIQSEKARIRNKTYRSRMRNEIKKMRDALDKGDISVAEAQLSTTVSVIQHTAQKGVIHRGQAARRVSRLANQLNELRAK